MALIYETENFSVEAEDFPLIDRNDGGHITINPKIRISTRQQLIPSLAIELMRLTMVAGEAMTMVMNKNGVDIGRVNYQDNGNWSVFKPEGPALHIHLYGRAKSASRQKYGHTLFMPRKDDQPEFYHNLKPLNEHDVQDMKLEIVRLLQEQRYADQAWRLI